MAGSPSRWQCLLHLLRGPGVVGGDSRSTISSARQLTVGVHGCLEHEIRRAGDSRVVSERPVSREELQEKGTLRQADPSELRTARPPASHREFSRPLAEPFTRAPAPRLLWEPGQEAPPAALAAQGRLGALPGHPGRAGHVGPRGALDLGSRAQLAEVAMVHQCLAKLPQRREEGDQSPGYGTQAWNWISRTAAQATGGLIGDEKAGDEKGEEPNVGDAPNGFLTAPCQPGGGCNPWNQPWPAWPSDGFAMSGSCKAPTNPWGTPCNQPAHGPFNGGFCGQMPNGTPCAPQPMSAAFGQPMGPCGQAGTPCNLPPMSGPCAQSFPGTPYGQHSMGRAFGQPMGTPCNQPPMSGPCGQSFNGTPYGQHFMDTAFGQPMGTPCNQPNPLQPATHEQSIWAVPMSTPYGQPAAPCNQPPMSSPYGQYGTPCGQHSMDAAFDQPLGTPYGQGGAPYSQPSMSGGSFCQSGQDLQATAFDQPSFSPPFAQGAHQRYEFAEPCGQSLPPPPPLGC
ncbi:unnamed protein product [Effrenium voratum]|nr:unnamed protein product [Effrenium voratum]